MIPPNPAKEEEMPPRVTLPRVWLAPKARGLKPGYTMFAHAEKTANDFEAWIPEREHEQLIREARAEAVETISKMALVHLRTGSSDDYGQGLYNGMMLAVSFITSKDANPVSLEQYREMQRIYAAQAARSPKEGET